MKDGNTIKTKGAIVMVVTTIENLIRFIEESKCNFDIGDTLYVIGWNCIREMGYKPIQIGLIPPFSPNIVEVAKKLGLSKVIVVDNDDCNPNKIHFRDLIKRQTEEGFELIIPDEIILSLSEQLDSISFPVIAKYIYQADPEGFI